MNKLSIILLKSLETMIQAAADIDGDECFPSAPLAQAEDVIHFIHKYKDMNALQLKEELLFFYNRLENLQCRNPEIVNKFINAELDVIEYFIGEL